MMSQDEEYRLISILKEHYDFTSKDLSSDDPVWKQPEIDLKVSADVFHKLGLIYMERNAGKMSFIQSAALLMAAQVRMFKRLVEDDLERLWRLVLDNASAQCKSISLKQVSTHLNCEVDDMRTQTMGRIFGVLSLTFGMSAVKIRQMEIEKINNIEHIQKELSGAYTKIMSDVAQTCLKILGAEPCKFALVGMGSLARKEVTPYSDFECIIILEEGVQYKSNYKDTIEYFRWLAVIFQIILISLGETILPSVAIPSLNDFCMKDGNWFYDGVTPNGISFDGFMPHACKTPLGRQRLTEKKPWATELIKPVNEMLIYLNTEEDLKNGYHLADILLATCFVFGDCSLHEEFSVGVNSIRRAERQISPVKYNRRSLLQLQEDEKKFNLIQATSQLLVFDKLIIKHFFYRSLTIFISALGKIHECNGLSSFEILSELQKKRIILRDVEHKLKYAVAISCEARLKFYCSENQQTDNVDGSYFCSVCNNVGEKCLVDYMTTTFCFQEALAERAGVKPIKIKSLNSTYTNEAQARKELVCFLHLYIEIENMINQIDNDKQCQLFQNVKHFFYATDVECSTIDEVVLNIIDNVTEIVSSICHNRNHRSKRRSKYKLRKRNYNHITATAIAKKISKYIQRRNICCQYIQVSTWMWEFFCDKYDQRMQLEHILRLKPAFITTDLRTPIAHLTKTVNNFKQVDLKAERNIGLLQFTNAWFVLALFKFYAALQELILRWNYYITKLRMQHEKLRGGKKLGLIPK